MTERSAQPHLLDLQGNILRGYRSLPFARFLYYHLHTPAAGRRFIERMIPLITPADWGARRPAAATNFAISFPGLVALDLPLRSQASFPTEFHEGMLGRAKILGDTFESDPQRWEPLWRSRAVHVLVSIYGRDSADRDVKAAEIAGIAQDVDAGPDGRLEEVGHQDAEWPIVDGSRVEHFGFRDGLSNPDIHGVPETPPHFDIGNPTRAGAFRKVPLGEFVLGWAGEGGESAPAPLPHTLGQNASFLVVRKLEQRVGTFRHFLAERGKLLARTLGPDLPNERTPAEYLAAKMMGRWPDGSPVTVYPDRPGDDPRNDFGYANDLEGARCPLGAHIRRGYPRDSLGFDGKTVNRRRIIRRGIAYGRYLPAEEEDDGAERGVMFLAYCSGLDQFEFVQSNWIGTGEDFLQGDDSDPILGAPKRRMMIPGDPVNHRRPFLCSDIPQFVVMRGGDYFFVPSIAGLRILASGKVAI